MLVSIGQGAILPLVALSARDLGASVGTAAFIVALIGIGQLLGDLPAGALAARIGEQRALVAACLLDAVALLGAFLAPSLIAAGAGHPDHRAGRVGVQPGPAGLPDRGHPGRDPRPGPVHPRRNVPDRAVHRTVRRRRRSSRGWTIGSAYAFAAGMSLAAAVLTAFLPDVTKDRRRGRARPDCAHRSVVSVLAEHRRVLLTLGIGVLVISAARSTRQSIVPLWADVAGARRRHHQPDLRRLGRRRHAAVLSRRRDHGPLRPGLRRRPGDDRARPGLPAAAVDPRRHAIALVAALMGLGNGISAGVVMTLGADAAPAADRTQFLGGWRLCSDLGNADRAAGGQRGERGRPAGRGRGHHGRADLGRARSG